MSPKQLRACDLRPGQRYWSPSGELVELLPWHPDGCHNVYMFKYLQRKGRAKLNEFPLSVHAAQTIAAMREAVTPVDVPVFLASRGLA